MRFLTPAVLALTTLANAESALRERVVDSLTADSLRSLHELIASEPSYAGSEGGRRNGERIAQWFESHGLEVERQDLDVYLPRPGTGSVRILSPEQIELPIGERPIEGDVHTQGDDLLFPMNGYSASGVAEGEVVYANQGRKEDFERLIEMGVRIEGRIVLARYGGNFRGHKARFAEMHGAAGLIIYTDPANAGFVRGPMYPEGGYANETSVERGSILTLPYPGDPLTPGWAATPGAARLEPGEVALPKIPVQPIGWDAAEQILVRMDGTRAPDDWRGGLDLEYRVEGGPDLRVRVEVDQAREITRVTNVVGALRGKSRPEELVIVGCHRDAWIHGAHDPHAGLIVVLELARAFGEAAKDGRGPARTILFAAWDAEEHGIIGSTEWVEAHEQRLLRSAVAYVNLDAASFGPRFRASASPSLRPLIAQLAGEVEHPDQAVYRTALDSWVNEDAEPSFGDLGGGSDHDAFVGRVGVPSASLGARGAQGTAYHTAYDTLRWYRQTVGEDYRSALLVARMAGALVTELAESSVPSLDPTSTARVFAMRVEALRPELLELGADPERIDGIITRARESAARAISLPTSGSASRLSAATSALIACDRAWLDEVGLPDRPWRRNLLIGPDEDSGYAAWPVPAMRWAVERRNKEALDEILTRYEDAAARFERALDRLETVTRSADR